MLGTAGPGACRECCLDRINFADAALRLRGSCNSLSYRTQKYSGKFAHKPNAENFPFITKVSIWKLYELIRNYGGRRNFT